jgi:hypothetical protein
MSYNIDATSREERKAELTYKWNSGKKGQLAVLSMFHKISPTGEALRPGVSVIDVIVNDEYGPELAETASSDNNASQATGSGVSLTGWSHV